jgi:hypothetical protein
MPGSVFTPIHDGDSSLIALPVNGMTDHECPTCGRTFEARRGLGVHHSHAHDERLPNRECDHCGGEFYSNYEKRYCSEACLLESDSYTGENNPNYRGGKETTACDICDDEFEYYPSEKRGLYCSECVETEQWRHTVSLEGEDSPHWTGGKLDLECDVCGDSFQRHPGRINGDATLCGDERQSKWLSEAFAGEGHPNYEGGPVGPYGEGWNETRRKALERDGHACRLCGRTGAEIGRNPDAHHITPVRVFEGIEELSTADAHRLDNVVSLCVECHRNAEVGNVSNSELRALLADG